MDNMDLLLKDAFEEMVTQEYENRFWIIQSIAFL